MILVVGGTGFVGQHLARWLLDRGEEVAVTGRRGTQPALLAPGGGRAMASVFALDVMDGDAVRALFDRLRPKAVVDLSGHPPGALEPYQDVRFRTGAVLNVLEAARACGTGRVVLMSSFDVYWGLLAEAAPYHEDDPVPLLEQDDHYIVQSWAKKTLELIGNLYRRRHGMQILFARAGGIYGPLYRTWLNVPSRLIRAAVTGAPYPGPLPFAESGYDQLYVLDAVEAIGRLTLTAHPAHIVYNIGSGGAPAYHRFAEALRDLVPGFDLVLPDRGGAAPDLMDGRWMDTRRAEQDLDFRPRFDVPEAMADWLGFIRANGL